MENLGLLGSILLAHLLAVMSPGPDFFMTVRNSLTYSRKTGIWTGIGIGAGISIHIIYCIAGLALVISKSILAFNLIKFAGAGYLLYIGIKSLRAKSSKIKIAAHARGQDIHPWKAFRIGFLTNVLNPKATLFFLSLFTLIIKPDAPAQTLLIASIIMVFNTALWFSLVAIFFTQQKVAGIFSRFQRVFSRLFGGILIALGIKVALSER